jgi:hypothetical protein
VRRLAESYYMTRYDWVPSALGRGVGGSLTGVAMANGMVILASLGWSLPNLLCSRTDAAYATRCTMQPKKTSKRAEYFITQFSHLRKWLGDKAERRQSWAEVENLDNTTLPGGATLHWQAVRAACRWACGRPSGLERSAGPWCIRSSTVQ